jgi:hypothetical protein
MKTHTSNKGGGNWSIFVTDDNMDTWRADVVDDARPKEWAILETFKKQREIFSPVED